MGYSFDNNKIIITVQHTESVHHTNGHVGAWGDWPLSERGREQARAIGRWLVPEMKSIDGDAEKRWVMYCSDLQRAVMTAEGINETLGLVPEFRQVIREVNAGEGNGKLYSWFVENKLPRTKDGFDPDYRPFADAESDRDVWNRLLPFYKEITESPEKRILIVSHGTALSFLQAMLCGYELEDRGRIRFHGKAGSVSRFEIEPSGQRVVQYLNRTIPIDFT